jgi:hypothetical protein
MIPHPAATQQAMEVRAVGSRILVGSGTGNPESSDRRRTATASPRGIRLAFRAKSWHL